VGSVGPGISEIGRFRREAVYREHEDAKAFFVLFVSFVVAFLQCFGAEAP
jgi:hypothetical protein